MNPDPQIRKLKHRMVVIVAVCLVAVLGIAIAWRIDADNRRANACESAVSERLDQRAMWDYLLQTNEHPTDPKVVAFSIELNDRLPLLKCERGSAVPVPETP